MKILWHSTKPNVPTGYGSQSKLFMEALCKRGYELTISCSSGLFGAVEMINIAGQQVKILPHTSRAGKYGTDIIEQHYKRFTPDLILSFIDCFIFDPEVCSRLPWVAWCPVDSDPIMSDNIKALKNMKAVLAPTMWGKKVIGQAGIQNVRYMPCAYSKKDFYLTDKEEARKSFEKIFKVNLKGRKLVNVVSSNTGNRKNFPAIFEAWVSVLRNFPGALLYVHADPSGYFTGGNDLMEVMKIYNVDEKTVIFPPLWEYACGAMGTDFLNIVYNASDVHVNACYGEGFGIPIIEAQACGCPVVVPDFGGASEICKVGIKVSGNMINSVPGGKQIFVNVRQLAEGIETVLNIEVNREVTSTSVEEYEINHVVEQYTIPIFKEVLCSLDF